MAADNFARVLAMKAVGELVDVDRIIQELTELIGDIESYDLDTLFGRVNQNTENIEIINGDETVVNSTYWKIANTDFIVRAEQNNVTGNWEFTNNDGTVTLMTYDSEPTLNSKKAVSSHGLYMTLKEHEVQVAVLPAATSSNVGRIYQYIGTTTADYKNGVFYQNVYDSTSGTYSWVEKVIESPMELSPDTFNSLTFRDGKLYSYSVQSNTIPVASVDYVNLIVQYTGLTTANYTNGYFYKCVAETEGGVTTYSWQPLEVQNSTHISADDFNALVEVADGLYVPASQISVMPIPDIAYTGKIIMYTGATTVDYVQGDYYIGTYDSTTGAAWEKLTYNKEEIDELISAAGHFLVVATLPTTDIKTNVIYLVPKVTTMSGYSDGTTHADVYVDTGTIAVPAYDKYEYDNTAGYYKFDSTVTGSTAEDIAGYIEDETYSAVSFNAESRESNNIKTEYINLDGTINGWEKIGDTEIDLSGYVKYEDLSEITLAEINQMWANAEEV